MGGINFMESSGRYRINLERTLISFDCGQIFLDRPFELCREKYVDSDEYLVVLNNLLMSSFSKEPLTESESKKLYHQILQDVPSGCARILFKYPRSFEIISDAE